MYCPNNSERHSTQNAFLDDWKPGAIPQHSIRFTNGICYGKIAKKLDCRGVGPTKWSGEKVIVRSMSRVSAVCGQGKPHRSQTRLLG